MIARITTTSGTYPATTTTTDGIYTYISDIGSSVSVDTRFNAVTPSGSVVELKPSAKGLNPQLYFKYVKSKLTQLEKDKLDVRMAKLKRMVLAAEELHQLALYDNLTKMLVITMRESEAFACGITQYVDRETVKKFIGKIKDKVVKFDNFDKFPRIPPVAIRDRIKGIQKKNLFDEYWIAYVDYADQKLQSNKDKIVTKDPILFGCYSYAPDRLYFIVDWVDEICDLTLDKMVETLRVDDPEWGLNTIPKIDADYFDGLRSHVMEQHERLQNTNRDNWRDNAKKESVMRSSVGFWNRVKRVLRRRK